MNKILLVFFLLAVTTAWLADVSGLAATVPAKTIVLPPEDWDLRPGPGWQRVQLNCVLCHSLDYIKLQPPLTKAQWSGVVTKMIRVYGAKISADDAGTIADYLDEYYGPQKR